MEFLNLKARIFIILFLLSRCLLGQYAENFDAYSCLRANMVSSCWVFSAFNISTSDAIANCSLRSSPLTGPNALTSPIFKSNSSSINVSFQHKFTGGNSSNPLITFQVEYPNGTIVAPFTAGYVSNSLITNTFSFIPQYPVFKIKILAAGSGGNTRAIIDNLSMTGVNLNDVALLGPPSGSCNNPFPLRLLTFDVTANQDKILITWSSSDEVSFKGFEVEKSSDAITFEKIAEVQAKNEEALNTYMYEDAKLIEGKTYYYRLKMIDIDGQIQFSNIISAFALKRDNSDEIILFPNPVLNSELFMFSGAYKLEKIVNDKGQSIHIKSINIKNRISLKDFMPGNYIFIFANLSGQTISKRVLKM